MKFETSPTNAAQLLAKGMQPKLAPANDKDYRELLSLYQGDEAMRILCADIARGMGLTVLAASERGLVLIATDAESRFAPRVADLGRSMTADEKAIVVLVHTAIAAQFYPTGESLEDERTAPPVTERAVLDALKALCRQLQMRGTAEAQDLPRELEAGWKAVLNKPESRPEEKRRSSGTLEGLIASVFRKMIESGLVRSDDPDGNNPRYTANYRLTVQLRNSTSRLYSVARQAIRAATAADQAAALRPLGTQENTNV